MATRTPATTTGSAAAAWLCNPRGYQLRGQATPENLAFDPARVLRVGNAPNGRAA